MKLTTLLAFGGAAAGAFSNSATAAPSIGAIMDTTSPFLIANGLVSARIFITGWDPGSTMQGFIGTPSNPWTVRTFSSTGFFNIDSVPDPNSPGSFLFEDGVYAAPFNNPQLNALSPGARFDSGLLGGSSNNPSPATFGSPADDDPNDNVGDFARFSEGGNPDFSIAPMVWLNLNPEGVVPPASLNVMRITWSHDTFAEVKFLLAMNTPEGEIPMSIFLGGIHPAPGALALLGVAAVCGSKRRRRMES